MKSSMKSIIKIMSYIVLMLGMITGLYANELSSVEVAAIKEKAKNNDKQGLYDLAVLTQFGLDGVEKNQNEAIELYKRASALGHRSANHNLGLIYYKGSGVSVDYPEAAKWFSIAAERKVEDSQRNLLNMYYRKNIPRDENKIEALLIDLAEKGKQQDIERLVDYYYYDLKDMALAEKQALVLAEKGVVKYQALIANIHIKKNEYLKAYPWLLKAADAGDYFSKIRLFSVYYVGMGVKQNHREALKWFKSACIQDKEKTNQILKLVLEKNEVELPKC